MSEAKAVNEAIDVETPDSKSAPRSSHCYPSMLPCSDCAWTVARIEQNKIGRWTMTCDECGTCATGDDLMDVMETWNDGPNIRVLGGMVRENLDA